MDQVSPRDPAKDLNDQTVLDFTLSVLKTLKGPNKKEALFANISYVEVR